MDYEKTVENLINKLRALDGDSGTIHAKNNHICLLDGAYRLYKDNDKYEIKYPVEKLDYFINEAQDFLIKQALIKIGRG